MTDRTDPQRRLPRRLTLLSLAIATLILCLGWPGGDRAPTARASADDGRQLDAFLFAIGAQDGLGQFDAPVGVSVAADGSVYVADTRNDRIQRFDASGRFVGTWGTNGTGEGQFNGPWGVAVAPDGDVYVADTGNDRVQGFTATGRFVAVGARTAIAPASSTSRPAWP